MDDFDIWFEKSLIKAKTNSIKEKQQYNESLITQEYLKSILHYDIETDIWTWIVNKSLAVSKGQQAGWESGSGYRYVTINNTNYLLHRLAYLYVKGTWPANDLDHINRIKNKNKQINLREANRSQNGANREKYANNTSGFKGVSYNKRDKKIVAQIAVRNRHIHLGYFSNTLEAAVAYDKAAIQYFGEFAVTNFPKENYTI